MATAMAVAGAATRASTSTGKPSALKPVDLIARQLSSRQASLLCINHMSIGTSRCG